MSVRGNYVFHGSISGLIDLVKTDRVKIEVSAIKWEKKDKKLFSVHQIENGMKKEIVLPCADAVLRQFSHVNDAITQSMDCSSVETADATKDDLAVYQYYELFDILKTKCCELEGLDPEVFLTMFTRDHPDSGEAFAWYAEPTNNTQSKKQWTYESWLVSAGIPVFRISNMLLVRASTNLRGTDSQNGIRFKLAMLREKWDLHRVAPVQHAKRTLKDMEGAKTTLPNVTSEKKAKKIVPSKEAKEQLAAIMLSATSAPAVLVEDIPLPSGTGLEDESQPAV